MESFTKVTWPARYKERLQLWASPGGKQPEPIAWDMRGEIVPISPKRVSSQRIIEHAFTHDGHPAVLTAHMRNCRRAENRYGISVKKEVPIIGEKIDAAVCLIGARMVRGLYLSMRRITCRSIQEGRCFYEHEP